VDPTTAALLRSLNSQRSHVLGALDGLGQDDLRKPVLPTGWSCLGLVQHLALDVERFWFRAVMTGELCIPGADATPGSAWEVDADVAPDVVLDLYRTEVEVANQVIGATPIDAGPVAWPAELFGDWRLPDLRAIVFHVITETACHAGHLDAARELIDGQTWLVL
jgi:hypothetical protein